MSAPVLFGSQVRRPWVGDPGVFTPPVVVASILSQWDLKELSGTVATDNLGIRNGTYQGVIERNLDSIVVGDATKSIGLNGSNSGIEILHHAAYALDSYSIVGYAQADVLPPSGQNYQLFNKDAAGVAGGVVVEFYNDGGQGRGRAYTRNSAGTSIYVGPGGIPAPNGVGILSATVAFRWTLTVGAGGVKFYLNNTLVGTTPTNPVGWLTNIADIYAFISSSGSSATAFDGVGKRLQLYSGELALVQITALPVATSITHDPPVGGEFITTPEAQAGWVEGPTTIAHVQANTAAFQAAINDASSNAGLSSSGRGVVELVASNPPKIYLVWATPGQPRDPNGAIQFGPTAAQDNVEVRTQGKPTGATRAIIKLDNRVSDAFGANQYGSLCPVAFKGSAAKNIRLSHLTVDGNKFHISGLTGEAKVDYDQYGDNGGLNAIAIDGANNVHFEWVESKNGWGDGLRIKAYTPGGGPEVSESYNLSFTDCDFHHNRRLAAGIIDCGRDVDTWDQVIYTRCKFRDTGDEGTAPWDFTVGHYPGQRPGAGVDMEPNNQSQGIRGVTIQNCTFDGNGPRTWNNAPDSTGKSRGLAADTGSVGSVGSSNTYLQILHNNFINRQDTSDEMGFIMRQNGTTFSIFEHVVVEGNTHTSTSSRYYCAGFPVQSPNRGTMTDFIFLNNVVQQIVFDDMQATGHSIICDGNMKPGGGATTITKLPPGASIETITVF